VISAANAPLIIADQNIVSPVGLLIGPPVVVLTSIALVAGFLLLLLAPFGWVAMPFAAATLGSLALCERLVGAADAVPGGSVYVPGLPVWWLIGFYVLLAGGVLFDGSWRRRTAVTLAVWTVTGLIPSPPDRPADELRVTFLAVGKGGCTVIETPDGRCLVYDAGSTAGPSAVRFVIAPYLWHRGIRRIDELYLSHADADHFNGVGELFRRFPVGQVTLTPSFTDKPTAEVAAAVLVLERYRVPTRIAVAGDRFTAGTVRLDVLHPPPQGPAGTENERSLVLELHHAGRTLLLTGDLEHAGTSFLLRQPPRPVDVLMAPHHGNRTAIEPLFDWSRPALVVVSRGPAAGNTVQPSPGRGIPIWDTQSRGAITFRIHPTGLVAGSFRDGERLVIEKRGD
jgi:competence protein ComEC